MKNDKTTKQQWEGSGFAPTLFGLFPAKTRHLTTHHQKSPKNRLLNPHPLKNHHFERLTMIYATIGLILKVIFGKR
jgi:hypothetical protein